MGITHYKKTNLKKDESLINVKILLGCTVWRCTPGEAEGKQSELSAEAGFPGEDD
jgi:hypothetical protein